MMLYERIKRRAISQGIRTIVYPRIVLYRLLSTARVHGKPTCLQPTLFAGSGQIMVADDVMLGFFPSPYYFSGYGHIEARNKDARVSIDAGTKINNNFVAIAEHTGISIGKRVLIGTQVEIYDSDFHGLEVTRRNVSSPEDAARVTIEDDVFIGNNVTILKGVHVGRGAVIGAGSLVANDIPPEVIAAGNPARILRSLKS